MVEIKIRGHEDARFSIVVPFDSWRRIRLSIRYYLRRGRIPFRVYTAKDYIEEHRRFLAATSRAIRAEDKAAEQRSKIVALSKELSELKRAKDK